jgi:hypothetical protein
LSEAATEFGQVGIEKPHSTGVCESQLENFRKIPSIPEQKTEVAIENRPPRQFRESQLVENRT